MPHISSVGPALRWSLPLTSRHEARRTGLAGSGPQRAGGNEYDARIVSGRFCTCLPVLWAAFRATAKIILRQPDHPCQLHYPPFVG